MHDDEDPPLDEDPPDDESLLWIHHGSPLTLLGHHMQSAASHPF